MSNSINVIQHNMSAIFTDRQLGITTGKQAKSSEKLSSGYRINRAADDAAGLSMSEKMRRQIRGLTQASKNMQDGISLSQVADGYLAEVHDMIQRANELAVHGANGTLDDIDRKYIDDEMQALKDEMSRVFSTANFNEIPLFHVPYTPAIIPIPEASDFGVFHADNSTKPGGLQFNNVRYSIGELQKLGMKIDDNGIATESMSDFHFSLWDDERVSLSLNKGESLNAVSRNYNWEGRDDGIYINNKLAVKWENLTRNNVKGLADTETFEPGDYRFTYHGTEISFTIDSKSDKTTVMTGITGDEATKAASWDIRAGSATERLAVDISGGRNTQSVTAANKSYIDHVYHVIANEEGLAIYHEPLDPDRSAITGGDTDPVTGATVKWSSFSDPSLASGLLDDSGEPLETNHGYPVVDWGLDQDSNDKTQITYDDNATYHFKNPDTRVKIDYDFRLAETTSRDEVISALDGTEIENHISAPGNFLNSAGNPAARPQLTGSDGSRVTITSDNVNEHFDLQRALGRSFTGEHDQLTGKIEWSRINPMEPRPAENVRIGAAYNMTSTRDTAAFTADGEAEHYRYIKVTDTDGEGNPIDRYYEVTRQKYSKDYQDEYDHDFSWKERVGYIYTGNLGGVELQDQIESGIKENYHKTVHYTLNKQDTNYGYNSREINEEDLTDAIRAAAKDVNTLGTSDRAIWDNRDTAWRNGLQTTQGALDSTYHGSSQDLSKEADKVYDGTDAKTTEVEFRVKGGDDELHDMVLTFRHEITSASAGNIRSGGKGSTDITWQADGQAIATLQVKDPSQTTSEWDFNAIRLNIPMKKLDIQSGSEQHDQIRMEWSPLNLSIIGMAGTNTLTQSAAQSAITDAKYALNVISETRMRFGTYQNRFEHAIHMTDNVVENTQRAESQIRDTDMSEEMVRYSNNNILAQAGQSMLAQANQSKQGILSMLG